MIKTKNIFRIISLGIISAFAISYIVIPKQNNVVLAEEIYTDDVISQKQIEYESAEKDRVIFDGFGDISEDSNLSDIISTINNTANSITVSIEFKDAFEPETERPGFDVSINDVNEAIRARRAEVRDYFTTSNEEQFLELNISNYSDVYVSRYSPYVDITFNLDNISTSEYQSFFEISTNSNVNAIYVTPSSYNYEEEMESAFPSVGLPTPNDIPDSEYDGSGVVVGVLEAGGIVDTSNPNISGANVIVRNEWYYFESLSEHALRVASIVGANTGIAREATILSVELSGNPKSEVEWMLDRNVNIITNSWSEVDDSKTGNYKSNSAYFDYISRLNWVTVCASAGNAGEDSGWVGNPGLGYNVITVGASTDGSNLRSFSSYKENFSISKPTLVAPGYDISVPTLPDTEVIDGTTYLINCGTSFSTPIVAGTIALLMQEFPILKSYPELVISMLTASASKMSSVYDDYDTSGLEDKVGAGKLNYVTAREIYNNRVTFSNSQSGSGYRATKSVYLNAGETIRISLAWLVDSNNETNTNIVTDYDLHLKNSAGTVVKTSSSGGNNIEFIEYTVTQSGTYSIGVYQYGDKKGSKTDFGAVSFHIE